MQSSVNIKLCVIKGKMIPPLIKSNNHWQLKKQMLKEDALHLFHWTDDTIVIVRNNRSQECTKYGSIAKWAVGCRMEKGDNKKSKPSSGFIAEATSQGPVLLLHFQTQYAIRSMSLTCGKDKHLVKAFLMADLPNLALPILDDDMKEIEII
eukprot:4189837-Ditylum_brightwellii.AAC.1